MSRDGRVALLLYMIAVNVRLVPLLLSGLPLNIDGFPLARIAGDIQDTGAWRIDEAGPNSYNEKMPLYSVLWAGLSLLAGLDPLRGLQPVMPFITSLAPVAAYALVLRLTPHRGVAFASGLLLAVLGSFVFLTASIMKESLGLVLLPILLLAFHRRADPRMRGIAAGLLALLPLLHHLTFLIAVGIVTALLVIVHHRRLRSGTWSGGLVAADILTGPATALVAVAYYSAVNLSLYGEVTRPDQVLLFLSVSFLFAVAAVYVAAPSPARVPSVAPAAARPLAVAVLLPAAAVGVLLLNRETRVFAGTLPTHDAFLALLPALAFLAVLGAIGFGVVQATRNRANDFLVAAGLAPLDVIAFAFLRGLDPLSFALVYRSLDYLDLALALAAGVGLALLWRSVRSRAGRTVLATAFVAALVATTPMAYASESVFGVQNVTHEYEFAALAFAAQAGGSFGSDQRISDVAGWWFHLDADRGAMVRLDRDDDMTRYRFVLVESQWTVTGAQLHPEPNLVLNAPTVERFLRENSVVYAGGVAGNAVYVVVPSSTP